MLFGLFAILTGAAVFAVLWPLAKPPRAGARNMADVAFYKAKLAEIEREATSGLLGPAEADAARTEAARSLLRTVQGSAAPGIAEEGTAAEETAAQAAAAQGKAVMADPAGQVRRRVAAVLALVFVPAVAFGLYGLIGHPNLPDAPLQARLDEPAQKMTLAEAIAKVEAHLRQDPNDGRGYEVLVPAYLGVGRVEDAVRAADLAMQKLGATPQRKTVYGETLVYSANGVVTQDARELFQDAALANPPPLKALFFLGLAAQQDGDKPKALTYWQKLLGLLPEGAGRADLAARIASLEGKTPQAPDEAAAIAAMAPQAQAAAIHGMIDRLAARLAQNGHDIDGWLRLVRAYKVINETDKAKAALASARRDFIGDAPALTRIDALARELGLNS